jgi:hypothetical protein
MDLSAFTRAGLKRKEIAEIVGVSATSAGLWMLGHRAPHYLLEPTLKPIVSAVSAAVAAGELPISAKIPRDERLPLIKEIIAQRTEQTN